MEANALTTPVTPIPVRAAPVTVVLCDLAGRPGTDLVCEGVHIHSSGWVSVTTEDGQRIDFPPHRVFEVRR